MKLKIEEEAAKFKGSSNWFQRFREKQKFHRDLRKASKKGEETSPIQLTQRMQD